MKEGKLVLMILIAGMGIKVYSEDSKEVWIFPPSTYIKRISDYNRVFKFTTSKINDLAGLKKEDGVYPFFVCDEKYLYLLDGRTITRINRSTIITGEDRYQSFQDKGQRVTIILGGGFFASTRIAGEYYERVFPMLKNTRVGLLTNRLNLIPEEMFDRTFILPQLIKNVTMSAPFLTEIVRGEKVIYDDDMLFYRWLYHYPDRVKTTMFFINDPTPLVEGAPGSGAGLSLEVEFHIPSENLVVLNGFVDLDRKHLYRLNARMKRVRVTGAGFEFEYEFADYVHFAQIDFPAAVTAVRLTVLEVYEGEKYEDLAISGLFVNPDVLKTRNSELAYEYRDEAERAYQKQNQQKR
jgi:hypothetical protein